MGLKMRRITRGGSFDHLVGAGKKRGRHLKTECLRGFQVADDAQGLLCAIRSDTPLSPSGGLTILSNEIK